jgi:predicted DNA-binding protein (MmcQ/YjbR family)
MVLMKIDALRKFCLSFPQATENLQWENDLCFKVGGKIFALISLGRVPQKICFKCDPETFAELIEREGIVSAPYVGRYKWALLERLDAVPDSELRDLIGQSYSMVVAKTKTPTRRGRPTKSSRSGVWMKSGSSRNSGI